MSDRKHLIGLLLGTEEDWPRAFEYLLAQIGPIEHRGETHELDVWGHDSPHDWPAWQRQIAHHLPRLV